ncbi:MAG TPA: helical backbone metal receptor, partial [Blastocatellia bacterium]|nr:helical backbone metal receptor [Blastocatellia bacterium]
MITRSASIIRGAIGVALLLTTLLACHGPHSSTASQKLRVISLSPGITEILYGIGAFDLLVADSQFCDYPEEAKKLPHVGGFYEANLEAITAMRPDLILIIDDQAVFFKDKLEKLGYRVVAVKSRTVTDVIDSMRTIGEVTGRAKEGNKLADEISAKINERANQTKSLPRVRILCVVDRIPGTLRDIYTAAPGSFIDGLIEASGG